LRASPQKNTSRTHEKHMKTKLAALGSDGKKPENPVDRGLVAKNDRMNHPIYGGLASPLGCGEKKKGGKRSPTTSETTIGDVKMLRGEPRVFSRLL